MEGLRPVCEEEGAALACGVEVGSYGRFWSLRLLLSGYEAVWDTHPSKHRGQDSGFRVAACVCE